MAALVVGGVATFMAVRAANVGPFKDSGLAMCEAIRDRKPVNAGKDATPERATS